jgi:DNA-binding response OmpR family regulator
LTKILVIEDELGLRDLMHLWLERNSYQCQTASTGRVYGCSTTSGPTWSCSTWPYLK